MALPLQERATDDGLIFRLVPDGGGRVAQTAPVEMVPRLAAGEQYRFHFDMGKCIGCRCCEVACNEQNNNPPEIRWRRVGEIEGGAYPWAERFYLSMGCNHCLAPSCLIGCPVDAYHKDPATGLVLHSAEVCIGCQYCTWNCPYGVPQYNPERGVVGKCDMCYRRLAEGRPPACVNACPQGAIQIEAVSIAAWKCQYAERANAPGLPAADQTLSTTRITLPELMAPEFKRADHDRVRPESPHPPLVAMTLLTQLSAGSLAAVWLLQCFKAAMPLGRVAAVALLVAVVSLGASVFHLGRPIYAYRALRMWRRSRLSREVLLFSGFALAASVYSGALWWGAAGSLALGGVTALLGIAAVAASAFLYLVPARPAWNSPYTVTDFYLTAVLLGSLFPACAGIESRGLLLGSVGGAAAQLLNQASRFLWLARSEEFELHASARLLSGELRTVFVLRLGLLLLGGVVLPLLGHASAGLLAALAGEAFGRYLFFVSVVPKNMAASFFRLKGAA